MRDPKQPLVIMNNCPGSTIDDSHFEGHGSLLGLTDSPNTELIRSRFIERPPAVTESPETPINTTGPIPQPVPIPDPPTPRPRGWKLWLRDFSVETSGGIAVVVIVALAGLIWAWYADSSPEHVQKPQRPALVAPPVSPTR